ncbi:MAG: hypothetical protein Q9215_007218 [Flavoplaca cf. flavocitrina]
MAPNISQEQWAMGIDYREDWRPFAPDPRPGITVYKDLKDSEARPGQTVAIVGAGGGLGPLACQYDKTLGLQVIVDAGEEKKNMCLEQLGYIRPRGTVVAIGLPGGAFLKAPVFETVIRMKTIKGSYVGN